MAQPQAMFVPLGQTATTAEQGQLPQGQQVFIQVAPPTKRKYDHYDARKSKILGWILITAGIVAVVAQTVGLVVTWTYGYSYYGSTFISGYGYWCPVFSFIAGSFAIVAARNKSLCIIVATMVLSIIAAVMMGPQFGIGLATSFQNYMYGSYRAWITGSMSIVMVLAALAASITAIWISVLGCKVTCCNEGGSAYIQPQMLYVNTPISYQTQPAQPGISHHGGTQIVVPQPGIPQSVALQPGIPQAVAPQPGIPQAVAVQPGVPQQVWVQTRVPQQAVQQPGAPHHEFGHPGMLQATGPKAEAPHREDNNPQKATGTTPAKPAKASKDDKELLIQNDYSGGIP